MRILFWNQEYLPSLGGVEIYTQNLAHKLAAQGHDVLVVASHSDESIACEERIDGIPVHRFPFYQALVSRDHAAIFAVQQEIADLRRRFRPELVHVNFTDASPFFYLRTRPRDEAAIVVFHSPLDAAQGGIQLAKTLAARVGRVIAPSGFMAVHVEETLALSSGTIEVIYNGAREDCFLRVNEVRSQMPTFVFAGRLVPDKGVHVLIEAFSRLTARYKARLCIVGAGPELAVLKTRVSQLERRESVTFPGKLQQSSLARCMAEATAVVVPSVFQEPFGQIAAEAALAGKAVIASNAGGLPEIVRHEETGLLVAPGDAGQLAEAMERMLTQPEAAIRYGRRARECAMEKFTLSAMAGRYEQLYKELSAADSV